MCLRKDCYVFARTSIIICIRHQHHPYQYPHRLYLEHLMYLEHEHEQESMFRSHADKDDTDADTDDDAGPCEDIVVLAKTHSGASDDTYCGSDEDDDEPARTGTGENRNRPNRNL